MRREIQRKGILMMRRLGGLLVVVAVLVATFGVAQASAANGWPVVARNLDNPRGLAFGPDGALYVAEAGRGGPGPCDIGAAHQFRCFGTTGAITRVGTFGQRRVVRGLPSQGLPDGTAAIGPHDVSFDGGIYGYVPIGLGADPVIRSRFGPEAALFGHLIRFRVALPVLSGSIADIGAYEATVNPDGRVVDSNPYAVLARPGHRYLVDAGGNSLLDVAPTDAVGRGHTISTIATFPPRFVPAPPFLGLPPEARIPMDPVPDSVTQGPDGALYVGELTGFPFPPGAARIYRVVPGSAPTVYADGFTNIIDLAFGDDGNLYVLQYRATSFFSPDPTGALIRVAPNGTRTTVASTGLTSPTGLALRDGWAYVSNFGTSPGIGEVVRIPLD
ncbi:MAG: ScyD/ScyE family protein [Gaiellaceae bacterium]